MRCVEIKDLLHKDKLECNFPMKDKYKFMQDMLKYQPKNVIYSYKFNDDEKFIVANGDNDHMMDLIDNELHMKIIEHVCDLDYRNPEKRINSIINNLTKLSEQHNIPIRFSKEQIINIINGLNEGENKIKILEAKNKMLKTLKEKQINANKLNINQSGGILIWLLQDKVLDKMENKTIANIFWGIFEIIDIVLLILQSIPGLQALAGVGFIFDIIAIIYSFLRFDVFGMVGGIISVIPLVGDIFGAIIRIIGKIKSYIGRFKTGVRIIKSGYKTVKGKPAQTVVEGMTYVQPVAENVIANQQMEQQNLTNQ
jgi:hypothetical protein